MAKTQLMIIVSRKGLAKEFLVNSQPPYELELEQEEYVEGLEKKSGEKRKDNKQRDLKEISANIL